MTALQSILLKMEAAADEGGDPEMAHYTADDLLVQTIRSLTGNHPEARTVDAILDAYQRVSKWYA